MKDNFVEGRDLKLTLYYLLMLSKKKTVEKSNLFSTVISLKNV
ncbi:hypothetical protein STAPHY8AQ_20181 [Staphylococcus sp. 8AQ]|nr:hypothetical protein STAPHY8AQ_20181 [Staphylococcus sp. 8AQ]